ncbi:uncharacterized protein DUF4357 [Mumia flava]|uniref:Uncharacterized protein DUF4357 n=1 Tax=Mumia flava TaxID=1348852 RepID=A0A0B2BGJ8_9ACTN|nr:GIY-YIG nuclease family protein [Mumia flava]PJJ54030.1 uncharacterized protein DUF4357 [Mumia flava]
MAGKQVRLFLADGTAGGLTTAEIINWTGKIVQAPRSDLGVVLRRDEAARTGAYLLLGDDPEAVGGLRCYVGEADVIGARLREHASGRGKDFWDRAVLILSKDENLTKAHARYLEARLIALASDAARCTLENGTTPDPPRLPEADVSDMDEFIAYLKIVLPVLGVNVLRGRKALGGSAEAEPVASSIPRSPLFTLTVPRAGVEARAQEIDGEFTLLAGSLVASSIRAKASYASSTAAAYAGYEAIHKKLREDGAIDATVTPATVTRDIPFGSPSTAGAIATGRSCNGRQSWIAEDGATYGEWERRGLVEP